MQFFRYTEATGRIRDLEVHGRIILKMILTVKVMMCGLDLFGPAASYCDHDEVFLIENTNKWTNIETYTLT